MNHQICVGFLLKALLFRALKGQLSGSIRCYES
jgi:hypothetical protein